MLSAREELEQLAGREQLVKFEGGASRCERKPDYSQVNVETVQLVAERKTLGAAKHGRHNYRNGGAEFIRETGNHLLEHALRLVNGDTRDDHLAAIAANLDILAWHRANKPAEYAQVLPGRP